MELLRVDLYPHIPHRVPRQITPGEPFPFSVDEVTRYAPEGDHWDYHVAGFPRVVKPPKLAPNALAFLHGVAPDFMDDRLGPPATEVDLGQVATVMLGMGETYVADYRCGVVDRNVKSLLLTFPEYMAAFLSMWPPNAWDRLSLSGRRGTGKPEQWAFEEDLLRFPGTRGPQATEHGERVYRWAHQQQQMVRDRRGHGR
eukprot:jgi/Mesvir1/29485/Mv06409-RA.1